MFIKTDSDRLQNLYYLQDVIIEEDNDKFYIGWVQTNGVIIRDGEYDTLSEAETKLNAIKDSLVS